MLAHRAGHLPSSGNICITGLLTACKNIFPVLYAHYLYILLKIFFFFFYWQHSRFEDLLMTRAFYSPDNRFKCGKESFQLQLNFRRLSENKSSWDVDDWRPVTGEKQRRLTNSAPSVPSTRWGWTQFWNSVSWVQDAKWLIAAILLAGECSKPYAPLAVYSYMEASHTCCRLAARWRSNIEYMSPCSESSALVKNLDTGQHVALDGAAFCFLLMHHILVVHKCCSLH